ncbi:glycosyltransferase [Paracoccus sp. (in: a-proteobacteria)]|uniref:glycosyltransferase family 2 protein n=1 Tax=Paracoccus sp. TaxID=267 RepID=UPI00321FC921
MNAPATPATLGLPASHAAGSWALCVATCDRGDILRDCVRHALASSLPPAEIVIVDASENWQDNRAAITALVSGQAACPLRYEPARRRSLTVQRNQAVALACADVLFMIDDDALLHPDTAARIMGFYRDDREGRLAAISCRNTNREDWPQAAGTPKDFSPAAALLDDGPGPSPRGINLALRRLLMIEAEQRFVGYDPAERRWQGTAALPAGLFRVRHIPGFALTLRRRVALAEPFDEGLVGSCIAEDLDASYRFGRHGLLAIAADAPIHHLEAAAGRGKRRINTALALLNVAYFIRRNSSRQGRDLCRYGWWYLRMALAELPKDLAGRRWHLPQLRGALLAGRHLPALLRQPAAALPGWYPEFQLRLISGARRPGQPPTKPDTPDAGVKRQNFPEEIQ